MDALTITPSCVIPSSDFEWHAVRASGPGGQNVNKVSSKVELRFLLDRCEVLTEATKSRLRTIARSYLTNDGEILIASQRTRDQHRNLEDARTKLRDLIAAAMVRPKRRIATKPTRASKERRLDAKRHQSAKKQQRGGRD